MKTVKKMKETKKAENKIQEVTEKTEQTNLTEQTANDVKIKKSLRDKGLILFATGGLLVVLIVVGAVAWYTRISVVNQMSMDAAAFDFSANYSDASFIIYAEDYLNIYSSASNATGSEPEYPAAPGTIGVIPVYVSAEGSDIDVDYNLNLSYSAMDPEFIRRIRFFYIERDGDTYASDSNGRPKEVTFTDNTQIRGKLKAGQGQYEFIYWEWVYDLNKYRYYDTDDNVWRIATSSAPDTAYFNTLFPATAVNAFDEYDTKIGTGQFNATCPNANNPEDPYVQSDVSTQKVTYVNGEAVTTTVVRNFKAYQHGMNAKINITGAMAEPVHARQASISEVNANAGKLGSAYCPVEKIIDAHKAIVAGFGG